MTTTSTLVALPVAPTGSLKPQHRVERRGPGRLLPHRLGDYELFDHIGKGGMADIYRARRQSEYGATRQVVVKEVLPELAQHQRFSELLIAEAKLAARLNHTNIVRVEHLGRDEGTLYIAMELVEGLDLRELLKRCAKARIPLPVELSLRIGLDLLKALDFAHRFRWEDAPHPSLEHRIGIVHRDVSPSNVLLSFDGEVKLCDFGIARAHDEPRLADGGEGPPLSAAMVEGKAGYMSPEQARGEALDGRADVFALGIILWELLSGKKLYKASAGETLLDVAMRAQIPSLPKRDLPSESELHAIVMKALAPRVSDRHESAGAMLRELEALVTRSGLTASSIKLGSWLSEHFESDILRTQRAREKAVEALARGPVATLSIIEEPSIALPVAAIEEPTPSSPATGETRPTRIRAKKKAGRKMAMESKRSTDLDRAAEEAPRSLEGTAADIDRPRADERKRSPLMIILILMVLAGSAATLYFLQSR